MLNVSSSVVIFYHYIVKVLLKTTFLYYANTDLVFYRICTTNKLSLILLLHVLLNVLLRLKDNCNLVTTFIITFSLK